MTTPATVALTFSPSSSSGSSSTFTLNAQVTPSTGGDLLVMFSPSSGFQNGISDFINNGQSSTSLEWDVSPDNDMPGQGTYVITAVFMPSDSTNYTTSAVVSYTYTVGPAGTVNTTYPTITSSTPLPAATVGTAYSSTQLAATHGTAPYTWTGGTYAPNAGSSGGSDTSGAPPGMTLSSAGVLSGTPTTAGSYVLQTTVTDANGNKANALFTVPIGAAGSSGSGSSGSTGSTGSTGSSGSGSTSSTSGYDAGTYDNETYDDGGGGSVSSGGAGSVAGPATGSVTIAPNIMPAPVVGTTYSQPLTASGAQSPYTWSLTNGSLPPGLSLNETTGLVGGYPTTPGSYSFTVQATAANNLRGTQAYTLTVTEGTSSAPNGNWGQPHVQILVGFGNGPQSDPRTFIVDAPGVAPSAGHWTDITQWCLGYSTSGRGKDHDLGQMAAGTAEFLLSNADGRFSPFNTTSPYNGYLVPRRWIQVRAIYNGMIYERFTGHVTGWAPQWTSPTSNTNIKIEAADALRYLNSADLTATTYQNAVIGDGAGCLYRCNDATGATLLQDATLVNPPAILAGTAGGTTTSGGAQPFATDPSSSVAFALQDAGSAAYIVWPNVATMPILSSSQGSFTMECWVNLTNLSSFGYLSLFTGRANWLINPTTGQMVVATNVTLTSTEAVPSDGQWHHLVVTTSTSNGTATWTCYIDAVPCGTVTGPAITATGLAAGTTPTYASAASSNPAPALGIANFALYNSTLSSNQVLNHFVIGRKCENYQPSGGQISDCLDVVGWPSLAGELDTGRILTQPPAAAGSLTTTSALSAIQTVEETEAGAFFASLDGALVFKDSTELLTGAVYTAPQVVFGDGPGEIGFQSSPTLPTDDVDLYNVGVVSRANGVDQTATNALSLAEFGPSNWKPNSTLLYLTDGQSLVRADYVVNRWGTPVPRFDSISIDIISAMAAGDLSALLALDLFQQVKVNRHTVPTGTTPFTGIFAVEQMSETVTATQWTMSFTLAGVDGTTYLIAGVTPLGAAHPYL